MLLILQIVTRIAYHRSCEALKFSRFRKELKGTTTLCGRQSESQGSYALFYSESGSIEPADGYKRRVAATDRAARGSAVSAQAWRTHAPVRSPSANSIRAHIVRAGQRARVLADLTHFATVGKSGLRRPVCGHLEDGVPHAEALSPFNPIHAFDQSSERARPGTGASLVVSSPLAATYQISPV